MSAPRVSIIVPVYNAEGYLADCLESIAGQTMGDFEALLVDDGSIDGSLAVCRHFADADPRFKVLTQENAGAAAARNRALGEALGEWLMFVDSDDLVASDCIERLLAAAESHDCDIALGGYGAFKADASDFEFVGPDCPETRMTSSEALAKILYQDGLDIAPWGKLFKRGLFDGVSFPPLRSSEDLATIYKPFLKARSVALVRDSGYRYRLVAGSLSYSKHEGEAWGVMRKAADEITARFPGLRRACCCRRLSFAFHVFLISCDPGILAKTWDEIASTRKDVLFDTDARRKARIAAAVSFLGRRATRATGKLMHFAR